MLIKLISRIQLPDHRRVDLTTLLLMCLHRMAPINPQMTATNLQMVPISQQMRAILLPCQALKVLKATRILKALKTLKVAIRVLKKVPKAAIRVLRATRVLTATRMLKVLKVPKAILETNPTRLLGKKDTTHDSDADGNDPTVTDPSEDVQTNPSQEELTPETGEATQSSSDIKAPAGLANSGATLGLPLVHHTYAEDMDTEKFIALIGEQARVVAQEYGLYASVMIAQAVLESGSGKSLLAQAPNNNLFGIKGVWVDSQGAEHSIDMPTAEDDGTALTTPLWLRLEPTIAFLIR